MRCAYQRTSYIPKYLAPERIAGSVLQKPTLRVQVPNNHIVFKMLTYKTTILKPST